MKFSSKGREEKRNRGTYDNPDLPN